MKIEIKIDHSCKEPRIIVVTDNMTEEIHHMISKLSDSSPQMIAGFKDDKLELIEPSTIIRIYANSGRVFAVTEQGEYTLRMRLYELEERLDKKLFVRISNSEIIHLKKVKNFDLSIAGTICVKLSNNMSAYVSRRYVTKIKQILGV